MATKADGKGQPSAKEARSMQSHDTTIPDFDEVERDAELRNVTQLIRFIALFVAVPTITIGLAFFLYTPAEHVFHMVAFLGLGVLAVVVATMAPSLAKRFTAGDQ